MNITIETSSYNDRRYGKPYIAVIDFTDPKGTPTWGDWIGQPDDAGMLSIEARPGDIIMRGQRDNRNMKHSAPDYYILQADMSLSSCTKAEAYKAWKDRQSAPTANPLAGFSLEELQAEITRRTI